MTRIIRYERERRQGSCAKSRKKGKKRNGEMVMKKTKDRRQHKFPISRARRRRYCERSEAISAGKEIASSPEFILSTVEGAPRNDRFPPL